MLAMRDKMKNQILNPEYLLILSVCVCVCDRFLCDPRREETPPPQEVSVNGPVWARRAESIGDGAADCQPPPEWLPQITSLQLRCFYWITLPCYWTWTLPINTNNEAAEHVKNKTKKKQKNN